MRHKDTVAPKPQLLERSISCLRDCVDELEQHIKAQYDCAPAHMMKHKERDMKVVHRARILIKEYDNSV